MAYSRTVSSRWKRICPVGRRARSPPVTCRPGCRARRGRPRGRCRHRHSGLDRVERRAPGEDAEPSEQGPFVLGQQVVAPRDGLAKRAMSDRARPVDEPARVSRRCSRRSNRSAGERIRSRAAASSIASGRPSRRRAISATASDVVVGEREVGPDPAGALDEQLHRRRGTDRVDTSDCSFASGSSSGASGYSCSHRRCSGWRLVTTILTPLGDREDVGELGGGRHHVLEVVDDEQPGRFAEDHADGVDDRSIARVTNAERGGDGRQHEVGRAQAGEIDETDRADHAGHATAGPARRPAASCRCHRDP